MHLVERIQRRLAAIVQSIPPRTGERLHKPPPPPLPPLSSLFGSSKHLPDFSSDSRISCLRCTQSIAIRGGNPRAFLSGECTAIGTSLDRPHKASLEQLKIGTQSVHPSHNLYTYKGLYYCNDCGCPSGTGHVLQGLSQECKVSALKLPISRTGKAVLASIGNDKPPGKLTEWPCFKHTLPVNS